MTELPAPMPESTPNSPAPDASTPAPQRLSGTAIASFVLGLLGPFTLTLTTLPAILCGHVARWGIRKSDGRLRGGGLALTGLVLGYLTAFGAIALVGTIAWSLSDESGTVSQSKVTRFADRSGLVIPAAATATEYRWVFARDGQQFLKLEMPASELDGFLAKSGLEGELSNTSSTGFTHVFGDFLPAVPKRFRAGQKSLPDGEALEVVIDEDSGEQAIVYLCWFGT